MNKYYQTMINASGDVLANQRLEVFDSSGAIVTIYADNGGTRFQDSAGNNINYAESRASDGLVEFYYVAATSQTLRISDSNGDEVNSIADFSNNVSSPDVSLNIDAILGVPASDENLGAFTGSIIPDDQPVKPALQSLETAVEARATLDAQKTAHIGLFSAMASEVIPSNYSRIRISGHQAIGSGAADYIEFDDGSTGVNDTYVTNNPNTAFKTSNSRYFRLSLDQVITPQMCGVEFCEYTGFSGDDQTVALQIYFDFIRDNACEGAEYNIEVRCDSRVTFGPASSGGDFKTPFTNGFMHIWSLAYQSDNLLTIRNIPNWHRHGTLKAECLGGSTYAARQTPCAIVLEQCSRASFEGLIGHNAQIWNVFGTLVPGTANSNLLQVGRIEGSKGGSGYVADSHAGTVFAVVRYGSSGSTAQFTAVSLNSFAELPPAALDTYNNGASSFDAGTSTLTPHSSPIFIKMADGDLYRVAHLDRSGGKAFVEGWVEDAAVGTAFRWIYGGGVCISGADSNIWDCSTISSIGCAIGLAANHFYGPSIKMLHMDACEIGIAVGGNITNASSGLQISKAYFEGVTTHILTTSALVEGDISQSDAFDVSLAKTTSWPRDVSGVQSKSSRALANITIRSGEYVYKPEGLPANTVGSTTSIDIGRTTQTSFYTDTVTFTLNVVAGLNDATGADTQLLEVSGSGTNGAPTAITFDPPAGYSINGGSADANLVFGSLTSSAIFKVRHAVGSTDLKVTIVGQPNLSTAAITATASSGTLPTANGSITIADATAPTAVELLEYSRELQAKIEALSA